ncbi:MAG: Membrane protein involved in the export of O-antigen and teichoic acid-like protein, partial [Acidobacteriaceae bacterium]|nr:Membrane protein involved in the export of O-antigen and teichoic acid-like protein [Acidobacteriaceae bacterium]
YLKSLFIVHASISGTVSATLGVAALVALKLHYAELSAALAGLSLAVPCLLLFHLARRIFYVRVSPEPVALGATLYFLLLLGGLLMLRSRMTPFLGFILMGAAALGSSCFLLWRATLVLERGQEFFKVRETWHRHWEYGRWAVASAMLGWVTAYACYPILSAFAGMSQVGALKALMNFAAPFNQTLLPLAGLILPYASRREQSGSPVGSNRITALFLSGAVAYWILVMCAGSTAFRLVYGGKYMGVRGLLPLFAVESIIWAAGCGPKLSLRAMNLPHCVFHSSLAPAILFLLVGIPSAKRFGIAGLVSAMALAELASYLIALWLLRRNSGTRVTTAEPVLSPQLARIPAANHATSPELPLPTRCSTKIIL